MMTIMGLTSICVVCGWKFVVCHIKHKEGGSFEKQFI